MHHTTVECSLSTFQGGGYKSQRATAAQISHISFATARWQGITPCWSISPQYCVCTCPSVFVCALFAPLVQCLAKVQGIPRVLAPCTLQVYISFNKSGSISSAFMLHMNRTATQRSPMWSARMNIRQSAWAKSFRLPKCCVSSSLFLETQGYTGGSIGSTGTLHAGVWLTDVTWLHGLQCPWVDIKIDLLQTNEVPTNS